MAYPTALQSSGPIGMSEVRDWMIAASELPPVSQVGLETLVLDSHLVDQTAPYNLSQFYSYSIPSISCGTSYTLTTTYINYREVVVGTISGNVAVGYSVYNDSGGLYDQYVKIEIQYEGGVWTSVLAPTTIYIAGSISGSANYIFTYNSSSSIIIRVTKSNTPFITTTTTTIAPTYYTYVVRPSNNLGTICTDPSYTVYSSSILLTAGDFIFYDTALTNPVTGFDYVVRASGSPDIYYMNPGTGELTSDTGIDC